MFKAVEPKRIISTAVLARRLERDECEAILTLQNNAAHNAAVGRGDLVRGSKARRLRRLAKSLESDADEFS